MDTCVPSPNYINAPFAPSPLSLSIYDKERPSIFCGVPKMDRNADVSGMEESGPLDDKFEDSSLKSILTPELLSSMASSSSSVITSTKPWENKYAPDESNDPHTSELSFIQLGMDSDIISDFLNVDSNDSKFSFPNFDFECMTSNPPSSCQTPVQLESKSDFVEPTPDRVGFIHHLKDTVISAESIGQDFVSKKFTMKSNFPPRKSEPPVGIVTPVKILGENKSSNEYQVKTEITNSTFKESNALDMSDSSPQTVPSFTVSNLNGFNTVKSEFFNGKRDFTKFSANDKWEYMTNSMNEDSACKSKRRRFNSGSSVRTSEDGDDDDNEYNFHNDDDSDDDNSDLDADLAHMKPGNCESLICGGKKQKQYFWQYNVQAKGPKGTRLKLAVDAPSDPHVLNGFEDPVFDEGNTTVAGIRHGGKARKGDGNEVTPNPHKLFKIGHQLLRLSKKINACQLGSDVPAATRNESRKEKNKLASRACRLKKKAQHEANKIKLNGLEMEHGQINNVLRLLWPELRERAKALRNESLIDEKPNLNSSLTSKLTDYISSNLKTMVAGNTTDYVNNVIMTVEQGDVTGGLKIKAKKT